MKRYFAALSVVVLCVLAIGARAVAAPGTLYVNDNNCPGPGTGTKADPYCTISEAVAAASPGNTIIVRPGEYNETVVVDKSLFIRGAQAGVTATKGRTKSSRESTLDNASGGFDLTADNITINGFTIEWTTDTSPTSLASGIRTSQLHSGYRIINNIIRDNIAGVYLNSDNTSPNVVAGNRFHANNEAGSGSGNGIESDQGLHNTAIHNNLFSGNSSNAIGLTDGPFTNSGIQIRHNRADSPVVLYNTSGSSVSKNTFGRDVGSAVFLGGNDQTIVIDSNTMNAPVFAGVRVGDNPTVINTGITISNNTIRGAGFYGIHIGASSLTAGTINANTVNGNDPEGIFTESGNDGNTFQDNVVTRSKSFDIEDDSSGGGTSGTANTYINNTCGSSDPSGLCV